MRVMCLIVLLVVLAAMLLAGMIPLQPFPEWKAGQWAPLGLWEKSQLVVVGDIRQVKPYGIQVGVQLGPPVQHGYDKLYWCEGELLILAVVKGSEQRKQARLLWASLVPGCVLYWNDSNNEMISSSRIWFLRKEGAILRPVLDYGMMFRGGTTLFLEVRRPWADRPGIPLPEAFAGLLLSPEVLGDGRLELEGGGEEILYLACSALGSEKCVATLRALSKIRPSTRQMVCRYLDRAMDEPCSISEPRSKRNRPDK